MSSREKAPIEKNVICGSNLDVLMIQVGERAERPFIPVILRMKRPLRSNPPYGSETRNGGYTSSQP